VARRKGRKGKEEEERKEVGEQKGKCDGSEKER
jgi:hypothetical protein